jgi:thymidylate synthase
MNTLDSKYQELLQDILDNGVVKTDRTGTGTISVFGRQIKHKMSQGFPLLTTKKMAWKTMVTELLWFLRGDTNIKYLVENGCNIWNGDAYKRYERVWNWDLDEPLPMEEFIQRIKTDDTFAGMWGELGPIYGRQWRDWNGEIQTELSTTKGENGFYDYVTKHVSGIDQISILIKDLKTNPDSRRLMVSAWNVGDLDRMVLPPCHYGFQVYTRELSIEERLDLASKTYKELFEPFDFHRVDHEEIDELYPVPKRAISLMWNQRSVDTFLGLPFNIASYGLLLEIIAKEVNMVPEDLIGNLGDVHLYSNHVEQAKEQINREPYKKLPTLKFSPILSAHFEHHIDSFEDYIKESQPHQFIIDGYECHPTIKAPLSN